MTTAHDREVRAVNRLCKRALPMVLAGAVLTLAASKAMALEKFVLILGQSTISTNEAYNLIVPQHLGYFEAEGLEVEALTSAGGTQGVQLLAAGRADVGLSSVPGVMQARQQGIKVRAVYNYLRKHATALAVLDGGPIKKAEDLKGKKIGIVSMAATRTYDGRAMVRAAGLDPDRDVQWIPVGFGAQAGAALQRGDVAALALWDATYVDMENAGFKLNYFRFPFQRDLIGYVYMSTDERIAAKRQQLTKFLRATAKASLFGEVNPEAAVCIYFKETKKLEAARDKEKAIRDALAVVRNNLWNGEREGTNVLWGSFPAGAMEVNQNYYADLGVLKSRLPPGDYVLDDPSFYRAVNEFDANAVIAQARRYKCE